ncbi:MAG: proton-conducting transporter membrane subunit, partial [Geminicoccaceae bacterium]
SPVTSQDYVLTLLVALASIAAALLLLGLSIALLPQQSARATMATAALSGAGALIALVGLLGYHEGPSLGLALGLPGTGMLLAFDPLSAIFLLLLLSIATACAVFALDGQESENRAWLPVLVGGTLLALLAADAFTLVFALEAMSVVVGLLVMTRQDASGHGNPALPYLATSGFGALCLIAAFALLDPKSPGGLDLRFAAMRAVPPEGWRATAAMALALLGGSAKAGLAPLHLWLPRTIPLLPSPMSALIAGATSKVALYVAIRVLLDLCGPVQPLWWGLPLLVLGAMSAVLGALRANLEAEIASVLACSTVSDAGVIGVGLGLALIARAADLPAYAALALAGAMLQALNHGLLKALLFLGAGAVQQGAGTRSLERLGGLIHQMPVTTWSLVAGCLGLASIPMGAGFAGMWLLFQSLLGDLRIGHWPLQAALATIGGWLALVLGLSAAACVRLVGVAFLGRPRSPRAAAASEVTRPARAAMVGLAALTGLLGLLPGLSVCLLQPALARLVGVDLHDRSGLFAITPALGASGYAASGLALLIAIVAGLALGAVRRWTSANAGLRAHRSAPAWEGGFAAPPPWFPLGDPATQYSAASFAQPISLSLGAALLAAREQVDMPLPADTRAARIATRRQDPVSRLAVLLGLVLRTMVAQGARLRPLTARGAIAALLVLLVLFLAAVGWPRL